MLARTVDHTAEGRKALNDVEHATELANVRPRYTFTAKHVRRLSLQHAPHSQ